MSRADRVLTGIATWLAAIFVALLLAHAAALGF